MHIIGLIIYLIISKETAVAKIFHHYDALVT